MTSRYRLLVASMAAAAFAPSASGCVACGSPAAHQLRQSLFAGDFAVHLLTMAAPFPVLLAAAAGLCRVLVPRA